MLTFFSFLNRKILTPESQLKKTKAQQKTAEQIAAERAARKAVCSFTMFERYYIIPFTVSSQKYNTLLKRSFLGFTFPWHLLVANNFHFLQRFFAFLMMKTIPYSRLVFDNAVV